MSQINFNFRNLVFIIFVSISAVSLAQNNIRVDTSVFPKAEKNQKKIVIELPHSKNDDNKKVEIFVGKNLETDTCNRYNLSGEFKEHNLEGWGYNYYTFETDGNVASTMMGCLDNGKKTQFVFAPGHLMRYNGRMPIVLYVPEGYEVKYKIYQTDAEWFEAMEVKEK